MDPVPFRRRIRPDAIIAFVVGVVAAYIVQVRWGFGSSRILTILIVAAVGGAWYKFRNVA